MRRLSARCSAFGLCARSPLRRLSARCSAFGLSARSPLRRLSARCSAFGLSARSPLRKLLVAGLVGGWIALAGGGLLALTEYKMAPGSSGVVPAVWPEAGSLERREGVPSLVMSLHPRCVCSRASLAELEVLRSRFGGPIDVTILFTRPDGVPEGWERTDTWETANRIPGARVQVDPDAREAALYGAKTSGHVALYDGEGRLLFRGGITGGRGHEGDNAGLWRALAALRSEGPVPEAASAPVFGCEIEDQRAGVREDEDGRGNG